MLQKLAFMATTFARSESGATAIEYGLIVSGIAVAILAAVNGVGTSMNATFKSISTQM
jgi:pilus assembly protein Flp/PilA